MDDELRALLMAQAAQIEAQSEQIRALAMMVQAIGTEAPKKTIRSFTIAELWEKYSAAMKTEMRPRSWVAVRARMKKCCEHFGPLFADALTPTDEVAYRTKRLDAMTVRKTLLSRVSYNCEIGALFGVLNWAVTNDLLAANPLAKVRLKKVNAERKTVYSEEDMEILVSEANVWLRAAMMIAKSVGMRPIEIITLEWNQIDRATRFVHLRADQCKNKKARSVRLDVRALEAIDDLPRGMRWVFTNPKSGNHWSQKHFNTWWRDLVKTTGLAGAPGETPRFYDLRATHVRQANRAGVSLPVIKETIGHSDYRQLQKYLRIDQTDIADGSEKLERYTESLRRRGPKRAATKEGSHAPEKNNTGE